MANTPKAGYRVNAWLDEVGFGRSKFYSLPADLKPRTVVVDGMTLIVEQPADYLARLAAKQIRAPA